MNSFETHNDVCRACNLELVEVSVEEAVNINKVCLEKKLCGNKWAFGGDVGGEVEGAF